MPYSITAGNDPGVPTWFGGADDETGAIQIAQGLIDQWGLAGGASEADIAAAQAAVVAGSADLDPATFGYAWVAWAAV